MLHDDIVDINIKIWYIFSRLLFPLSFMAFNLIYWTIYFKTAEDFSWGKHAVKGNIGE